VLELIASDVYLKLGLIGIANHNYSQVVVITIFTDKVGW